MLVLNLNARDNENKMTALAIAFLKDHPEIAKMLIEAGAYVNVKNDYRFTALDAASESGHTEIVRLLKEAGAR